MTENSAALDHELVSLEAQHSRRLTIQLWQTIGATKLANQIASSLGSQTVRALESIRDEELYKAAGFDTFDKFLDQDPDSPMSYEQFRRRSNLLKGEGDVTYDLLNSLNVPFSQRKLLAGQIEVTDENEIKIAGVATKLDDGPRIVELISKLHSKNQEQQRTIDRGKKDVDKWKRKAVDAEGRATIANPTGTATGQALLTAAGALVGLKDSLASATDEEKEALKDQIFDLLHNSQLSLSEIYMGGHRATAHNGHEDPDSDSEAITLSREDLEQIAEEMN